ncbi:MAG: hypothetical protein JW915_11160 [Chitinispirillaceae bacterium]|nr:hypothetical protein [Chitinispirillaceae bacterium]
MDKLNWIIVLGSMALVYNPIIRVHLTREIWSIVNIITILVLITSIHFLKENHNKSEEMNVEGEGYK